MIRGGSEVARYGYPPARDTRPVFRVFIGRDADRRDPFLCGIKNPELVEMVVEPTHGVLDSNVEVPERVRLRNLDAPPDARIGAAQYDEELVNGRRSLSSGLHFSWSADGHRFLVCDVHEHTDVYNIVDMACFVKMR